MSSCEWCHKNMLDPEVVTCTGNARIALCGVDYETIAYAAKAMPPEHRCHDCNVKIGGKHHPRCDMERCPRCSGQLISCGCIGPGGLRSLGGPGI